MAHEHTIVWRIEIVHIYGHLESFHAVIRRKKLISPRFQKFGFVCAKIQLFRPIIDIIQNLVRQNNEAVVQFPVANDT